MSGRGPQPVIFGCEGRRLSKDEKHFFRDGDPWGFTLFARNIHTPLQVQRLVGDLREAVGRTAPVLIDQEGGRVARLGAPHWQTWPPVRAAIQALEDKIPPGEERAQAIHEALMGRYETIGRELSALGINVNCVPLLDIPQPGGHPIIGDRALGEDPSAVIAHARAVVEGGTRGGVLSIIKHIPGHGRASVDSHLELPVVDTEPEELAATDWVPFKAFSDHPMAMTAHVVYSKIDPDACATYSETVIQKVIRGELGFSGLLMTDDLSMGALRESFPQRTRQALRAGCDMILHCNGERQEMEAILGETAPLEGSALERAVRACGV